MSRGPLSRGTVGSGFQLGLVAGAAAGLVMLAARLAAGVPTIPELLLDFSTRLIPPAIFSFVLDLLLFAAKPLLVGTLAVGQLLLCGGLGALYEWLLGARTPVTVAQRQSLGIIFGAAMWVVLCAGLLPLTGAGWFGSSLPIGPVAVSATLLSAALVYGLCLAVLSGWVHAPTPESQPAKGVGRRALIRVVGLGSLGLLAGGFLVRSATVFATELSRGAGLASSAKRPPAGSHPQRRFLQGLEELRRPRDRRSRDGRWRSSGLVERPLKLSYAELAALPSVERAVTLECVSNFVGGNLIGNAIWKGTALNRPAGDGAVRSPRGVDVVLTAVGRIRRQHHVGASDEPRQRHRLGR